jgi:DNA polymerase-3 subunit alpha/error-prone DNA polymerase
MRGLLRRLKCDNYKTLVAASVSFALSGPDGMMREYIFRHNHPDRFEYFHEVSKSSWVKPMVSWSIKKM